MIHEELGRLVGWEERHQRLVARLAIAVVTAMAGSFSAFFVGGDRI